MFLLNIVKVIVWRNNFAALAEDQHIKGNGIGGGMGERKKERCRKRIRENEGKKQELS